MKDKDKHYCDNIVCNHNNTKGLCCLFNPDNCKYRQLQKENAELKKEWQEQVQKATDEGYARTLQTIQLTKAKEIIRDFLSVAIDYIDPIDKNYSLIADAEQFLKDQEEEPCGQ